MKIALKLVDKEQKPELIPEYATSGSAGLDLKANIKENIELKPGESILIDTGLAVHIGDNGFCGIVVPRSGLGSKHGIVLGNGTGVIDADYQGELKVSLWNRSDKPFIVEPLMRIAQLLIQPVVQVTFDLVMDFKHETARAGGGFGSTGIRNGK